MELLVDYIKTYNGLVTETFCRNVIEMLMNPTASILIESTDHPSRN